MTKQQKLEVIYNMWESWNETIENYETFPPLLAYEYSELLTTTRGFCSWFDINGFTEYNPVFIELRKEVIEKRPSLLWFETISTLSKERSILVCQKRLQLLENVAKRLEKEIELETLTII